jgi:hypothetical protein
MDPMEKLSAFVLATATAIAIAGVVVAVVKLLSIARRFLPKKPRSSCSNFFFDATNDGIRRVALAQISSIPMLIGD